MGEWINTEHLYGMLLCISGAVGGVTIQSEQERGFSVNDGNVS